MEDSQFDLCRKQNAATVSYWLDEFDKKEVTLPKKVDVETLRPKLLSRRWDEIEYEVIRLWRELDVRTFPLNSLAMANALGCTPILYRSLGKEHIETLLAVSQDGFSVFSGKDGKPQIFYNDRQKAERLRFTLMHEIAHVRLRHLEHSRLGEVEANHFAGVALCPPEFLAHTGINDVDTIAEAFGLSIDCATHCLSRLLNRRKPRWGQVSVMETEVTSRFHLAFPVQLNLFSMEGYNDTKQTLPANAL